jgi:hypothetical protein
VKLHTESYGAEKVLTKNISLQRGFVGVGRYWLMIAHYRLRNVQICFLMLLQSHCDKPDTSAAPLDVQARQCCNEISSSDYQMASYQQ